MRIVVLISIMLLLPLNGVWGEDYQKRDQKIDGYAWEQLDTYKDGKMIQGIIVRWFTVGFMAGYSVRSATHKSREKDPPKDTTAFPESIEYYVREIDSFLKTYPLCRRKSLVELLFKLSAVWLQPEIAPKPKPSYKDIGESCLNPDK